MHNDVPLHFLNAERPPIQLLFNFWPRNGSYITTVLYSVPPLPAQTAQYKYHK